MGCVCSKGIEIEPQEGHHSPPSEAVVIKPRQTPSDPSLLAKSCSFHGFEKPDASVEANKAVFRTGTVMTVPRVEIEGIKPVKENFFILRDRMEMRRAGKVATIDRRINGRGLPARAPYPGFAPRGALEETTVFERPGWAGESSKLDVANFRMQKLDFQSDELLNLVLLRIKG